MSDHTSASSVPPLTSYEWYPLTTPPFDLEHAESFEDGLGSSVRAMSAGADEELWVIFTLLGQSHLGDLTPHDDLLKNLGNAVREVRALRARNRLPGVDPSEVAGVADAVRADRAAYVDSRMREVTEYARAAGVRVDVSDPGATTSRRLVRLIGFALEPDTKPRDESDSADVRVVPGHNILAVVEVNSVVGLLGRGARWLYTERRRSVPEPAPDEV